MKSIATVICLTVAMGFASFAAANPLHGEIRGVTLVAAHSVNVHKVLYRGGEQADFAIRGDGDTTLNLVVRNAFGNIVVSTSGPGDIARVTWRPNHTGYFYISVVNSGGVFNRYVYRAY